MENLQHKSVTATYKMLDVTDGAEILLEETTAEQPLKVMTDMGMLPVARLEDTLKNTPIGEDYDLTLTPEEGFGEHIAERVVDIDKAVFSPNGVFDEVNIREGVIVPLQNEDGQRFMAQIKHIGEDKVTIDLNHPLAGKTLRFCGTILDSHDASEEEIMALLNQMNHHSCGGGCSGSCGSCGGNCGGNCGEGGCEGGCGNCGN